ncbi:MAG: hypothetical protein LKG01_04220 [Bifidobacterium subtile]|jgi:hypothetical protein|nr:hypothetical protein [Bifidobacterium subtile]
MRSDAIQHSNFSHAELQAPESVLSFAQTLIRLDEREKPLADIAKRGIGIKVFIIYVK